MNKILEVLAAISWYTLWITPLTFTIGLIYAIKKPEEEALPYKIIAIISAYLIVISIINF